MNDKHALCWLTAPCIHSENYFYTCYIVKLWQKDNTAQWFLLMGQIKKFNKSRNVVEFGLPLASEADHHLLFHVCITSLPFSLSVLCADTQISVCMFGQLTTNYKQPTLPLHKAHGITDFLLLYLIFRGEIVVTGNSHWKLNWLTATFYLQFLVIEFVLYCDERETVWLPGMYKSIPKYVVRCTQFIKHYLNVQKHCVVISN